LKEFYSIFNLDILLDSVPDPQDFMGDPKIWIRRKKYWKKIIKQAEKNLPLTLVRGLFTTEDRHLNERLSGKKMANGDTAT